MSKELLVGSTMLAMWIVSKLIERRHPAEDDPADAHDRVLNEMADQLERSHRQMRKAVRRHEARTITSLLRGQLGVSVEPMLPNVRKISGRLDQIDGRWIMTLCDDQGVAVASYLTVITDAGLLLTDPTTGATIRDRAELAANLRCCAQSTGLHSPASSPANSPRRDSLAGV